MPCDFENYKVSYALWNIGDYFWHLGNELLQCEFTNAIKQGKVVINLYNK